MESVKEAITQGNESAVKKWLFANKNGITSVDADGNTVLHYACSENQHNIAELLLKKGASPNVQDAAGWTPFHVAASARNFQLCQLLLNHNANPSITNNSNSSGFAYLGRAVGQDQELQIQVLQRCVKEFHADLQARNDLGETVLHTAALRASPRVVQCLIDLSSDINDVNIRGENTLHYAVRSGHPEVAQLLLQRGVNFQQKSTDNRTPLEEAKALKITKLIQPLQQFISSYSCDLPWTTVKFRGRVPDKRSFPCSAVENDVVAMVGGAISAVRYSEELSSFSMRQPGWDIALRTEGDKIPQLAGSTLTSAGARGMYLFGGRNAIHTSSDLVHLDLELRKWKLIQTLDKPRCHHTANLLPDNETLLLFGGSANKGRGDFLNSVEFVQISTGKSEALDALANAPSPRMQHQAALWDNTLYVWGGKNAKQNFDDLYAFDVSNRTWKAVSTSGERPSARSGHCMVAHNNALYVFGGTDDTRRPTNLLHVLDLATNQWKQFKYDQVPALSGHTCFVLGQQIYFLGWADQFQFLVLDPTKLNGMQAPSDLVSRDAWKPDASMERQKTKIKVTVTADLTSNARPDPSSRRAAKSIPKKTIIERIEKLEFFSDSLSVSVLELIQKTETELQAGSPFSDAKNVQDLRCLCNSIQQFCVTERPSKSWAGNSEPTELLQTVEKPPFPMTYYESLAVPPKRVQPEYLQKKENATAQETAERSRNLVLNEIITTEIDYVRDLAVLIGLYLRPLREEYKDVLSSYESKGIFKNAEALWDVHVQILQLLLDEEKKPAPKQQIGNIFIQMKESLGKYNEYCANQQISSETAERLLKENAKFRDLVEEIQQLEASKQQKLSSYLVKPFQRITRYPLLLKELIKQTPKQWPDRKVLEQAMADIGSVVQDANEMKRTNDRMKALFELQDRLSLPAGSEHNDLNHLHKFAFDSEVYGLVEVDSKKGKMKKGGVHLFANMILITLNKGSKLQLLHRFPLDKTYAAIPAGEKDHWICPVEFSCGEELCFVSLSSEEERRTLLQTFKELKKNLCRKI